MSKKEDQSYKTLLIALAVIGIFLVCIIISQTPQITANLNKEDSAYAGAVEPSDEEIGTEDPNATEQPDEPLEEDNDTGTPTATATRTPFPTVTATATPFPTDFIEETPTPAPTFDVDIPGEITPTISPTPKPAVKGNSNIGLIVGAVIGTILLVIGIVWVILSRQRQSGDYTMPAPTNPTYPPYQPDNFSNTPPVDNTNGWTQPGTDPNAQPSTYTTPYDQYVGGNDPNNQPK